MSRQDFRLAHKIMQQSVYFPYEIAPRAATEDEIGDLFDFYQDEYDMPRGDAQGVVECMNIAVFEDERAVLSPNAGKVLIAFAGGHPSEVNVFIWKEGRVTLARTYVERELGFLSRQAKPLT